MNERIKDLANQAGFGPTDDPYMRQSFDVNLFAELIIQQCILAVELKTNTHHIHTTFDEQLVLHTISNSAKAIKEHFGVE